jgi:hypothetical protein
MAKKTFQFLLIAQPHNAMVYVVVCLLIAQPHDARVYLVCFLE